MALWTCKGKGGRYRLITKTNEDGSAELAVGAGTSEESEGVVVYRDVVTQQVFFEVIVTSEADEPVTARIHDALLEFTGYNIEGVWPRMEPYLANNGVWLRWTEDATEL
jgi:hypothetical protein